MNLPRIIIALCFVMLLGVPMLFRPASDASQRGDDDALSLIIITPHNEQIRYEFARAFDRWHERIHGQRVNVIFNVPGGTSEIRKMLESQFIAAFEAGREPGGDADLVFGGGSFEHSRLRRGVRFQGRDEPISQPVDFSQDWLEHIYGENDIGGEQLYDNEGYWFGLALSGFGIVYNNDLLRELGIEQPTAWRDLCDPRLRGWIALVNPNQSGSVTTAFESILKREGWVDGWRILRRAAANARYFSASSLKPPTDVTVGNAAMGVCIDFYGRFQSQALIRAGEGERIGYIDPPGGSTIDADPISMLRGAPHHDLARRFIEFCLSNEGQALWQFAASPSNANDAAAMGPLRFALRRLPVRRSMYAEHMSQMIDQVDPFAIATPVTYPDPHFRDFIAPLFASMAIDNHHRLRDAWTAIVEHPAYPKGHDGLVTADDVSDSELKAMLQAFDRLPVVPGPDGTMYDLGAVEVLGDVRNGWLRNGWKDQALWHAESSPADTLRRIMGTFFRERYMEAAQLRGRRTST